MCYLIQKEVGKKWDTDTMNFFYLPIQDSWSQFEGKKIKSLSKEWVKKTGIPQPGDIQKMVP